MITIGSLFSGIGGLELGLEWAGLGPVVFQCEIDPFCRAVLAKHWPNAVRFEDVTQPRVYPHVDVVCGGFPCQDVSDIRHGSSGGLRGPRSSLWWYFASVIRQVAPRFVVVENVGGGAIARWLPTVRRHMCELGYQSFPMGVAARDVGAPHRRARVFVVAHASRKRGGRRSGEVMAPSKEDGETAARRVGWDSEPEVGRVVYGLPRGMDNRRLLRALGNAVVPQCAEIVGRVVLDIARSAGRAQGAA